MSVCLSFPFSGSVVSHLSFFCLHIRSFYLFLSVHTVFLAFLMASLLPHVEPTQHYLSILAPTVTWMPCSLRANAIIPRAISRHSCFPRAAASGSVGRRAVEQWLRVYVLKQSAWFPVLAFLLTNVFLSKLLGLMYKMWTIITCISQNCC